jgi:UDP-GlcNAc:undecaprenyl-phosphate/decaprenyl-phosphate GlcNAc-1-phosphate transferase
MIRVATSLVFLPIVAFLASAALTAGITRICKRRGWVVMTRPDRWHKVPVAQFGGIAIIAGFVLAGCFSQPTTRLLGVVLLTVAMAAVGLVDDVRSFQPKTKLAAEAVIAIATVSLGVVYPLRSAHWVNICFTVVWIVGITNAINLLDNMDGLAAGIAIVAGLTLSYLTSNPALQLMTLGLVGALSGFLIFNFKPAKIFMGDTGSLAIGYFLACASVLATEHISTVSSILFVPVLVLFIPLFDTGLVSVTRRLSGRAISAGARDHTSHRLVMLGISERKAVLVLYGLAVLSGAVAILWKRVWPELGWGAMGVFLLVACLFWVHLAKLRLPDEYLSRTNAVALVLPALLQSVVSKMGAVILDMCVIALSLYLAFLLRFEHLAGAQFGGYLALCCIALVVKLPPLALFGAYRPESTISSRVVYTLAKSAVVGSLAFVSAVVFWNRFDGISRAVFGIDLLLTTSMLVGVRWSGWLFDHALRSGSKPRCLLVDNARSRLVNAYFDEVAVNHEIAEVILAGPEHPEWSSDLLDRIGRNHIQAIYCGPDCDSTAREYIHGLAASHGLRYFEIDFGIREVPPHLAIPFKPKPIMATNLSAKRDL